jgi:hypothetical protein
MSHGALATSLMTGKSLKQIAVDYRACLRIPN